MGHGWSTPILVTFPLNPQHSVNNIHLLTTFSWCSVKQLCIYVRSRHGDKAMVKIAISDETQESDKLVTTSSKIDKELGKGIAAVRSSKKHTAKRQKRLSRVIP